jgi:hypothetical protein
MKKNVKKIFALYLFLLTSIGFIWIGSCSLNPFYGVGATAVQETVIPPHVSAPVLTIISPVSNQEISGVINLVGTAVDASAIDYVKVSITGTNASDFTNAVVNNGVFSFSRDVIGYAEGNYTIYVYAADVKGNVSPMQSVTIIIDREIPQISISSPTNGEHFNQDFTISGTAMDSNTIDLVQYTIDNVTWNNFTIVSGSSVNFSSLLNTASMTNGQYTIKIRAFDKTGKYGTDAAVITIDKEAPVLTVLSPTNETTLGISFTISATAADNQGINLLLVRVDGSMIASNALTAISTLYVTNSSCEGSHIITVETYDYAGNKDEENMVIVINENPSRISNVSLSSSGTGNYLTGLATISGIAYDSGSGEVSNIYYKVGSLSPWILFASNCGVLSTNWSFTLNTALYTGGMKTIYFKPVDNLGGFVQFSTNIYIDNASPSVTFINPSSPYEVRGGYLTISVSITDNVSLKQFTLYTNGNVCTNIASILPLDTKTKVVSALWDLMGYTNGTTNTIVAVVKDMANKTYTLTNKIIVANNTPSVIMQNPSVGSYVPAKINIKGIAIRSDGIMPSWVKIGSGSWITVLQTNDILTGGTTNFFNHSIDASAYSDGNQTITVRAFASNGSYVDQLIPVILDKINPSASITSPTNGNNYYGSLLLAGTASDNMGISYASLKVVTNGVTVWGPTNAVIASGKWSVTWNTVTLPVGNISVILEVSDYAGNKVYKTNSAAIAPYITSVSESSTWVGKVITNKGYNFGSGTVTVNFNGASASGTATMTNVIVTVPAGAKSGYLSITVKGVTSINSNWIDLWSITKAYANANGQLNSRFCIGGDDKIYFVQSAKSGSTWASNILISSFPSAYTVKNVIASTIPNGEVMGQGNDIDVRNGILVIIYSPAKMTGIYVSVYTNSGSAWVKVVDKSIITTSFSSSGAALNGVRIDASGKIHIAYSDKDSGNIMHGVSTNLGSSWTLSQAVTGVTFDPVILDGQTSIDIDSGGNPHIMYFNYGTQKMKHAWKAAGIWYNETVDNNGYNGLYSSIKIDAANGLHVSYYNGDNGDLMYTYKPNGGSWTTGLIVDYSAITGNYTAIDVYGSEKAIAYFNAAYNTGWMSYNNGTAWRVVRIPQYTPDSMNIVYGKFTGVGFTSAGALYAGFVDAGNQLWVAEYKK